MSRAAGVHMGGPGAGHLHMHPHAGLGGRDYGSMGGALAAMRAAMSGLTVSDSVSCRFLLFIFPVAKDIDRLLCVLSNVDCSQQIHSEGG